MEQNITPEIITNRFNDALQYKQRYGLHEKWKKYDKFKAGEQWGKVTEATKNFPRPVFNMVKHIVNFKKASVMNENVHLIYTYVDGVPQEGEIDYSDILSRYSKSLWEEVKQDKLNGRALDYASVTGSAIWHYYWDSSFKGGNTVKYLGRMKGEVLNPINVYFGNPQCLEVQDQPWIIILSRLEVNKVREMAAQNQANVNGPIQGDNPDMATVYEGGQYEVENDGKVNLYTMYYKVNNVIYYVQSTENNIITPPTDTEFELYPMALMNWDERSEFIYGSSEVEGMLPNQKALNMLIALQVMSVQLTGFPKMVYKKGAIDPAKITNTIGEMVEDKSNTPGMNVQYLNAGQVSPLAGDLTQRFLDYTKDLSGTHRNVTGEARAENATAIMLLQKTSGVALDDIRKRFYEALNDIGLIWLQFFKHRYNTIRLLNLTDADHTKQLVPFNGENIKDLEFKLEINVGVASAYAETFTVSALDKFLQMQLITFEQYLKYVPKNIVPFKDALLREIEKKKQQEQQQMENEMLDEIPPELREKYEMMNDDDKKAFILALAQNKEEKLKMQMKDEEAGISMNGKPAPEEEPTPEEINDMEYDKMMAGEGMFRPERPKI